MDEHVALHTADTQNGLRGADSGIDRGDVSVRAVAVQPFEIFAHKIRPVFSRGCRGARRDGVAQRDEGELLAAGRLVNNGSNRGLHVVTAHVEDGAGFCRGDGFLIAGFNRRRAVALCDADFVNAAYALGRNGHDHADAVEATEARCIIALMLCLGEGKFDLVPAALRNIFQKRPPAFFLVNGAGAGDLQHTARQVFDVVDVEIRVNIPVLALRGIDCRENTEEYQITRAAQAASQPAGAVFIAAGGLVGEGRSLPCADLSDRIDHKFRLLLASACFVRQIDFVDSHRKRARAMHRDNAHTVELAHIRGPRALGLRGRNGQIQLVPAVLLDVIRQRPPEFLFVHRVGAGQLQHTACQVLNLVHIEPDVQIAVLVGGTVLVREGTEEHDVIHSAVGRLEPGCAVSVAAGRLKGRGGADPVARAGNLIDDQDGTLRCDKRLHAKTGAEHFIVKHLGRNTGLRTCSIGVRIRTEDCMRLVVGPVIPADIVGVKRAAHVAREGQAVLFRDTGALYGGLPQQARRVGIHTTEFHAHNVDVSAVAAAPCVKALRTEHMPVGVVEGIIVIDHLVPCTVILAADVGPEVCPDSRLQLLRHERNRVFNGIRIILTLLNRVRDRADIAPRIELAIVCIVIVPANGIGFIGREGVD